MNQLRLITGAWLLEGGRWARENLYALLVLAPLVLGMTYFGVGRMVREAEWSPGEWLTLAACVAAAACLAALSLSRASVEVYHVRRPEWVLDALPVSAATQLGAALLLRASRTLAVAAAALVLRWLAGGEVLGARVAASLALLVASLASGETLAALGWVRWSHRRAPAQAAASLAGFVCSSLVAGALLADVLRPRGLTLVGRVTLLACGVLTATVTAALAFAAHARWRAADAEYAKRLGARETWGVFVERLSARACRGRAVLSSQLARDLRLTLRGFSSAVYAAAGVAALVILLLLALLAGGVIPGVEVDGWASWTWTPRALSVKFACVVASAALASVLPVLVEHQRPHLWLERSVGLGGEEMWKAKLYLARVVTAPAPLAAWAVGLACGATPVSYAPALLAECVWLWWIVSTAAGGLAFEMPEQPGLALVLVLCASLAAGGLTAFVWPMGLAIYGMGVQPLCLRGVERAQFYLKESDV